MDNGITGVGEAAPVGPGRPPSIADIAAVLHDLAPSALGLHPAVAFDVLSALAPAGRHGGRTALRTRDGPPSTRWGRTRVGPSRTCWAASSTGCRWSRCSTSCPRRRRGSGRSRPSSRGYECVKVSLGARDPDTDVEVVRRVRRAIGDGVGLRADVDEGWTAERAVHTIERLRPYGLEFVEQPVIAEDLSGLARIRRSTHVPIAADEAVATLADAERVVWADAADVLVVKAAKAGGLRHAQAIMAYARDQGMRSTVSSSLETGIGDRGEPAPLNGARKGRARESRLGGAAGARSAHEAARPRARAPHRAARAGPRGRTRPGRGRLLYDGRHGGSSPDRRAGALAEP